MIYHELSIEERATIQVGLQSSLSLRAIARLLNRSPSTVSREIKRNRSGTSGYTTQQAQRMMASRRLPCRPANKLIPGSALFDLVESWLRK